MFTTSSPLVSPRRAGAVAHPGNQKGATMVILAFMAVGLATATAVVADLGQLYYLRTRLQVATDAAALAGAQALTVDSSEATRQAKTLAKANGFVLHGSQVSFPTTRRCHVELHQEQPLLLGKLLGIGEIDVAAASTAELNTRSSGQGPRPFGVPDTDFVLGHCVNPGREYVFKTGADEQLHGEFEPLALDGPGVSDYTDAILHGARRSISVGDILDAQPGDMSEQTVDAIDQLVGDDETPYDQAVAHPDQTPRVIDVPLIAPRTLDIDGRTVVRVTGIGHFYITYAEEGRFYGRFIGSSTNQSIAGSSGPATVKLVE